MSTQKHFTATVKKWRKGWEVYIDGLGVTQARKLSEARERASDYILSLTGEETASVDFSFDLGDLSEKVAAARSATMHAAHVQKEPAAQSRKAAAELREAVGERHRCRHGRFARGRFPNPGVQMILQGALSRSRAKNDLGSNIRSLTKAS